MSTARQNSTFLEKKKSVLKEERSVEKNIALASNSSAFSFTCCSTTFDCSNARVSGSHTPTGRHIAEGGLGEGHKTATRDADRSGKTKGKLRMTAEGAPRIEQVGISAEQLAAASIVDTASGGGSLSRATTTNMARQRLSVVEGKRPVVAVDVDEVLGHFVHQLCRFHNAKYRTTLTPDDFVSYNFHEVWGGTRGEADSKMRLFFDSPFFLDGIPAVKGAAEVLKRHRERVELHIVTSRQHVLEEHTTAWVNAHYPGIFEGLHFGNHFSEEGIVRSKPALCEDINAVMIIDDNVIYATQCARAGIRTCLFGERPSIPF